jgi:hypothetical protein
MISTENERWHCQLAAKLQKQCRDSWFVLVQDCMKYKKQVMHMGRDLSNGPRAGQVQSDQLGYHAEKENGTTHLWHARPALGFNPFGKLLS